MATEDNTAVKGQLTQMISSKSSEINNCNKLKQRLNKEKGNLQKYRNKWKQQYQKHLNSKAAKKVVIHNVFEGKVADKLKGYYGDQVENMQKTSKKTEKLCEKLDSQIRKLETYVSQLESDVSSARSKLKNMEG